MADDTKNPLPTILNFRDVGKTVNAKTGSRLLKPGRFYRSARPDEASAEDRKRLVNEFHVRSIIDLRTETEHVHQSRKTGATVPASAAVPKSKDAAIGPLRIPNIKYHDINFNGKGYQNALVSQLTWSQWFKLVGLMTVGRRMEAIAVLGVNVMQERGLVGLALDSLDACGEEVQQVFGVLADESNYPVMIHCTQGKDRTGLTVMLALLLLGVPVDAIEADYMMSQKELQPERESRIKEIKLMGLGEEFADCSSDFVRRVDGHITEKYGSVEEYLNKVGVDTQMQRSVLRNLSARVQR